MTQLVADKKIHILSVNNDSFLFHPCNLLSFDLKVFLKETFIKLYRFLDKPKPVTDVIKFIADSFNVKNSQNIIEQLIEKGFIQYYDDSQNDLAEEIWVSNNWKEAMLFHLHTNKIPKMMYNTRRGEKDDLFLMNHYLLNEKPPSNYKEHKGTTIFLNKPEIEKKYRVSHTLNPSSQVNLDFNMLSRLLYYALGQIGVRYMGATGAHVRKTIPSGGARHPIEGYLITSGIENLDAGIYHYNVKSHALTLIRLLKEDVAKELIKKDILLDANRPKFNYSTAIVYSCVYERSMFRYRESRSYRVMQFDMGHITQNLLFLAKAYGLNLYCGYSCRENKIEKLIGIDSLMESVISYSIL